MNAKNRNSQAITADMVIFPWAHPMTIGTLPVSGVRGFYQLFF
tara:strand:+ start:460 stop:588 length:129 start_codon:yes stop_codon:yes gene_type:complete